MEQVLREICDTTLVASISSTNWLASDGYIILSAGKAIT